MHQDQNTPIIAIADDFTGAAEIAGIGLRYGLAAEVQTAFNPDTRAQLIVVDSDTRSGNMSNAALTVRKISEQIQGLSPHLVYKKTDSVLRGHVEVEIDAVASVLEKDRMLLVPANPGMGRMIHGGFYYVNGVRLHETDFGSDPEYPAGTSEVTALLDPSGRHAVRSIETPSPIPRGVLVIGDVSGADTLAEWASHIQSDCLPAGGGEFFASILETLGYTSPDNQEKDIVFSTPSLFVSGSMSAYSRDMVKRAVSGGMPVFTVPTYTSLQAELTTLADSAISAIAAHGTAMLAVDSEIQPDEVDPRYIPEIISGIAEPIIRLTGISSLYLTGGATAAAVLRHLGWTRFVPEAELSYGVSKMSVIGPGDCSVIVKPGSYPWPDAFLRKYFPGKDTSNYSQPFLCNPPASDLL